MAEVRVERVEIEGLDGPRVFLSNGDTLIGVRDVRWDAGQGRERPTTMITVVGPYELGSMGWSS